MRKEDVSAEISSAALDFLYWFSRFEYALKEGGYLKSRVVGAKAEPDWNAFVIRNREKYKTTDETCALIHENPQCQVVSHNSELTWAAAKFADAETELGKVVRLLKIVRNNLFHGGKHGGAGWDDPARTTHLLLLGKAVLDQLAQLAGFEADYTQYY